MLRPLLLAVLLALTMYAGGIAAAVVRGQIDLGGHAWTAVDALAYPCDEDGVCVAIAATTFDRESFRADGVIDSVDIHEGRSFGAMYLVLSFDADGILRTGSGFGPDGEIHRSDDGILAAFELDAFDGKRIAGRLDYQDDDRIDVRCDLAIESNR